jgi:hypothetical protein
MNYFQRKKRKKLISFFSNFASWLIISTFLFILNVLTDTREWWFIYPFLGWGLGVAFHALSVFKFFVLHQDSKETYETNTSGRTSALPEADYEPLPDYKPKEKRPNQFDDSEFV